MTSTTTRAVLAFSCLLLAAAGRAGSFEDSLSAAAPDLISGIDASRQAEKARVAGARPLVEGRTAEVSACLRDMGCRTFYTVAHRTGGFGAPENSVEGVRRAIAGGISLIETDIRFTKDGAWVMLHDPELSRTTNLRGPVSEKTLAELQAARLSDGEPLPRFQDLYAASRGRAILVLDLKVNAVDLVAAWLEQNGSFDDVIFFASDAATLASCSRARARYPRMMVMVRVEDGLGWDEARAAYGGGLPLIVHSNFPAPELSERLRAGGSKLYTTLIPHDRVPVWREDIARLLIARGSQLVDTDDPRMLQSFAASLRPRSYASNGLARPMKFKTAAAQ